MGRLGILTLLTLLTALGRTGAAAAQVEGVDRPASAPAPVEGTGRPASAPAPVEGADRPTAAPAPVEGADRPTAAPAPIQGTDRPATAPAPIQGTDRPTAAPAPVEGADRPAAAPAPIQDTDRPATAPAPVAGAARPQDRDGILEALESAHRRGTQDHVLTVRHLRAVTPGPEGRLEVQGVTQVIDGRSSRLVSQDRCDPCEESAATWPPRPEGVWFVEASWPSRDRQARLQALTRAAHLARYYTLEPLPPATSGERTWMFWRFEGRRARPLPDAPAAEALAPDLPEPPPAPRSAPAPAAATVARVDIFRGASRPDEVHLMTSDSVGLRAVAWGPEEAAGAASQVARWRPLWSSSCGTVSDARAKEITFRLNAGADQCRLYLFDARSGAEDSVIIHRGHTAPPVRLVLAVEGGREADAVALTGSARSLVVEARAFDPGGQPLAVSPEWSVEGGRAEFLDPDRTRLRVHLNPGVDVARVRVRDPASGAEDNLEIRVNDSRGG